jgi:chromosomal replication initiator protein
VRAIPQAPTPELNQAWAEVEAKLSAAVDDATYRIWLEPLRPASITQHNMTVTAPPQACGWVRERFGRLLQTAVAAVLGPEITVDLLPEEKPASTGHARGSAGGKRASTQRAPQAPEQTDLAPADLFGSPKLTFEQFVIGDSNRLAHAAALAVAEMPAQAYNPLFICGPPGVGKTHLLGAIRALMLAHDPSLIVRCITGEQFTNEFLHALGGGSTEGFKLRFRHADVLLIDDIQFLERKARTEEEFFHTFNALYDSGSQLVLTSDRPPANLDALEDRLRERFAAGLVADISPPDRATRLTILRKRVHCDGVELADERALHEIADRITTNVRALEGALIRIVAFASLTGRPITTELAAEVLDGLYPTTRQPAATVHTLPTGARTARNSIDDIQQATCEQFGITSEELLSTSRTRRIAWPRQVAMYLARELSGESLPSIGRHFGGRDHTTVLHAWRRTAKAIEISDASRTTVDDLRRRLAEQPS